MKNKTFKTPSFFLSALVCLSCLLFGKPAEAQNLQLHEDFRHSIDPAQNPKNYPSLYFEYFKNQDSGKSFLKPGAFLLKTQVDLSGDQHNIGQSYIQVSQSLRFWKPKVFLSLQYNGGLGVTDPKQYSYYITNTYSAGASYTFPWKGAWLSSVLAYKYLSYPKPSQDFIFTQYWWSGHFHYKLEFAGDFSIWTENKDHGDAATANLTGKRFFFFGEPQVWLNLNKTFAIGSKINLYYHVNTTADLFQVYPTAGLKWKL